MMIQHMCRPHHFHHTTVALRRTPRRSPERPSSDNISPTALVPPLYSWLLTAL